MKFSIVTVIKNNLLYSNLVKGGSCGVYHSEESMSWYNPSQDEAADEYYSSKNRYTNAANQRYAVARAAESCCAEKTQALSAINSCQIDKLNFERRIEDIRQIVYALEGGAGSLVSAIGADIPTLISRFNKSVEQTDSSYRGSIFCRDIKPISWCGVFQNKNVGDDSLLSGALEMFKNEITRLENALRDLEVQMNNLHRMVDELTSKINMYTVEQDHCRSIMISSAYEMNHFKLYM